jgi:signal transduction histidine kinase
VWKCPHSARAKGAVVPTVSDLAEVLERRRPDARGGVELRGLLHDLGHGLATLSYLADGMRDDPALPGDARYRLSLMEQQLSRLLELVDLRVCEPVTEVFDARELIDELVSLTALSTETSVTLRRGEQVHLRSDKGMVWRMVANLVDNAVRAAGPEGSVEVAVERSDDDGDVTIEIADDGPGFGHGPGGMASLGIGIVAGLAKMCAANLQMRSVEQGGTRARLVFSSGGAPPDR